MGDFQDCVRCGVVACEDDSSNVDRLPISGIAEINPVFPSPVDGEIVSFVCMADVSITGMIENFELRTASKSKGYTPFIAGDVLVAKITPSFKNGKGAYVQDMPTSCGLGSTEFYVLRAKPQVLKRYLFHLTRTLEFRARGESMIEGSAQQRVPRDFFDRYMIRLLPLREQQRIAEILDTVDETIHATERVISKYEQVRVGLAGDLLSGRRKSTALHQSTKNTSELKSLPASNDVSTTCNISEWETQCLGEIAQLRFGKTPPRSEAKFWNQSMGYPWATIADMRNNPVVETAETVSEVGVGFAGRLVPAGSILMSFKLTVGRVIRTGIELFTNEAIVSIHSLQEKADDGWLYHVLPSVARSGITDTAVKGSTLNKAKLEKLTVQLPPLREQQRIAEILDTVDATIRTNQQELDKLRKLRSGLATDLLSGRVRTLPE